MGYPALDLRADCANCFGLCCVALPFARSADFAFTKAAGEPCGNLQEDFRCGIHEGLRESGFKGCTVYDCFGAGQKVAQATYDGTSWRDAPETAGEMYAVFPVVRQLHEMLWYLGEGLQRAVAASIHHELSEAMERIEALTFGAPSAMLALDVAAERATITPLLERVSAIVRQEARVGAPPLPRTVAPNADLLGATLPGADLRGANLRGAYLIAADLAGADLRGADLLGADLRDARLAGANLGSALFLTQFQVGAAKGDATTMLSPTLERPAHWAYPAAR
jgi:uncharacterized protein YjbI with pentapeptide repeats